VGEPYRRAAASSAHLQQPGHLSGRGSEQLDPGRDRGQTAGERQDLVVASGEVGAFMSQHRTQVSIVECAWRVALVTTIVFGRPATQ
jgi:hypothetical protein